MRNPYAKHLKKQVTLRLNTDAIAYFKALAKETGIPYQNLINLYLTEVPTQGRSCRSSGHLELSTRVHKYGNVSVPPFQGSICAPLFPGLTPWADLFRPFGAREP